MRVKTPDQVVVQLPETCTTCQHDLMAQPIDHLMCRQVFDLPAPRLGSPIPDRVQTLSALSNDDAGSLPDMTTTPVQYGSAIQALAMYLSQVQLLPDHRIVDIFTDLLAERDIWIVKV